MHRLINIIHRMRIHKTSVLWIRCEYSCGYPEEKLHKNDVPDEIEQAKNAKKVRK